MFFQLIWSLAQSQICLHNEPNILILETKTKTKLHYIVLQLARSLTKILIGSQILFIAFTLLLRNLLRCSNNQPVGTYSL